MRAQDLLEITHTFNGNGTTVLVGSAVGGGSLVYSGVSLRAPSFVFGRRSGGRRIWPQALSRRSLDPYYRCAERGLGVHQLGFEEVAKRGGIWAVANESARPTASTRFARRRRAASTVVSATPAAASRARTT